MVDLSKIMLKSVNLSLIKLVSKTITKINYLNKERKLTCQYRG